MRIPKTLGGCIDLYYELQKKRDAYFAAAEPLTADINKLNAHLLKKFGAAKLRGARGARANCTVVEQLVPNVLDWQKIYKFVAKHDAFELLQKRLSSVAWRERREAGVTVPGTEAFNAVSLRINVNK
jgi:hypothetical protein